jgi:hypothetical protein
MRVSVLCEADIGEFYCIKISQRCSLYMYLTLAWYTEDAVKVCSLNQRAKDRRFNLKYNNQNIALQCTITYFHLDITSRFCHFELCLCKSLKFVFLEGL